jgi:Fe(3+) dicitrate transport protein
MTWQMSAVSDIYTDAINTELPTANAQAGKVAGYEVMDLSATYRFLKRYNIKASINNLTDVRYATRRAGGYPGPGLLPNEGRTFYLSVGMRW